MSKKTNDLIQVKADGKIYITDQLICLTNQKDFANLQSGLYYQLKSSFSELHFEYIK